MEFKNTIMKSDLNNAFTMLQLDGDISTEDTHRLQKYKREWNFYDGFHWEEIPAEDKPQITENYCRAFVHKFVVFEMGKGFTTTTTSPSKDYQVYGDKDTIGFIEDVWNYNSKLQTCLEIGQMKSITGDSFIRVEFLRPSEMNDPFGEYPDGKIRISVLPSATIFPTYNEHDPKILEKLEIRYPIEREGSRGIIRRSSKTNKIIYRQVWTNERVVEWEGDEIVRDVPNKYGIIPIVQLKNIPVVGRTYGVSDLEDLIPLNVEHNLKKSDVSEILDYHSAPVTLVFGARVGDLQRGANKVWGGLPKDGNVKNLELNSDLTASNNYISGGKRAMHEIGSVPEGSLGGQQSISNTSGVALQYANLPLIERTTMKRSSTKEAIEKINKLILLVAEKENIITKPSELSRRDFFDNNVTLTNNLPKDELIEIQKIREEMLLGIENRKGAMKRLGKENIDERILEIDEDRRNNPNVYGLSEEQENGENTEEVPPEINSGMTNGETPIEQVRREMEGRNG